MGPSPATFRLTGAAADYQFSEQGSWPAWGRYGDLAFGRSGQLGAGNFARCVQGYTYEGDRNDACGGQGNWGATEMEVWYRVER